MIKIRIIGNETEVTNTLKALRTNEELKKQLQLVDYSEPYKSRKRDDEWLVYLSFIER